MGKLESVLCVAAILCVLLSSLCSEARAAGDQMCRQQLTETIAKVRTGKTSATRRDAAEHLFELTRAADCEANDKTITELASLMELPDDSVRYWVARSLGNFGQRAKIAAPKLQKVLAEVDCLEGSKTSASGIRFALSQMGITPPPAKCGTQN